MVLTLLLRLIRVMSKKEREREREREHLITTKLIFQRCCSLEALPLPRRRKKNFLSLPKREFNIDDASSERRLLNPKRRCLYLPTYLHL